MGNDSIGTVRVKRLPEPSDEFFLALAEAGNERDFRPMALRFRCSVLRPVEIVRRVAKANTC